MLWFMYRIRKCIFMLRASRRVISVLILLICFSFECWMFQSDACAQNTNDWHIWSLPFFFFEFSEEISIRRVSQKHPNCSEWKRYESMPFSVVACILYVWTIEQYVIGCHKIRRTILHAFGSKCAWTKSQIFFCTKLGDNCMQSSLSFCFSVTYIRIYNIWSNVLHEFFSAERRSRLLCPALIFRGITATFI